MAFTRYEDIYRIHKFKKINLEKSQYKNNVIKKRRRKIVGEKALILEIFCAKNSIQEQSKREVWGENLHNVRTTSAIFVIASHSQLILNIQV